MAEISGITFILAGEKKTWFFDEPLVINKGEIAKDTFEPVSTNIVSYVGDSYYGAWKASRDLVIDNISFSKFIDLTDLEIYKAKSTSIEDMESAEKIGEKELLPLELSKGDCLIVKGNIESQYCKLHTTVYGSSILEYSVNNKKGIEATSLIVMSNDDAGDETDRYQKQLEYIVDNKLFD